MAKYHMIRLEDEKFGELVAEFNHQLGKTIAAVLEKTAQTGTVILKMDIEPMPYMRDDGSTGLIPRFTGKVSGRVAWNDSNTVKINHDGKDELVSISGGGFAMIPVDGQMSFEDLQGDDADPGLHALQMGEFPGQKTS